MLRTSVLGVASQDRRVMAGDLGSIPYPVTCGRDLRILMSCVIVMLWRDVEKSFIY